MEIKKAKDLDFDIFVHKNYDNQNNSTNEAKIEECSSEDYTDGQNIVQLLDGSTQVTETIDGVTTVTIINKNGTIRMETITDDNDGTITTKLYDNNTGELASESCKYADGTQTIKSYDGTNSNGEPIISEYKYIDAEGNLRVDLTEPMKWVSYDNYEFHINADGTLSIHPTSEYTPCEDGEHYYRINDEGLVTITTLNEDGETGEIVEYLSEDDFKTKYHISKAGRSVSGNLSPGTLSTTVEGKSYDLSDEEYKILCATVYAEATEAGGYTYSDAMAVTSTILNRVESGSYPDTVTDVVSAPYQFDGYGYSNSKFSAAMSNPDVISDVTRQAINDTLAGERNVTTCSFRGNGTYNSFF